MREKERVILRLTVEHYLQAGTPASSGYIADTIDIPVSPATVRNIMSKLEKSGYLIQPHTSAGRITSDKGLRFYVNNIFEETLFSAKNVDYNNKHTDEDNQCKDSK